MKTASSSRYLNQYVELRPSPVHGMGLFAKRTIPANTIWWKASRNNVLLLNQTQYHTLMTSHTNDIMNSLLTMAQVYGYYSRRLDSIIICLDNARYVNHAFEPNSGAPADGNPLCSMTLREIAIGEEITEDYTCYDLCEWSTITCSDAFLNERVQVADMIPETIFN